MSVKYIFFVILLLNLKCHLLAQSVDSIISPYVEIEQEKINTLVQIVDTKSSTAWLNILPNLSYDLDRNSVNVGISLSQFSQYAQQKRRNKIEQLRLKAQLEERLEDDLIRLENEYLQIKSKLELVQFQVDNFSLSNELFEIKEAQYNNDKINLEDWLKYRQSYVSQYKTILSEINTLKDRINYFKLKAKSSGDLPELSILLELNTTLNSLYNDQR